MAYRVVAASWPRPLGGIYVTMLCSLHLIIKQHLRRRMCIVCEKGRDQETQVLGAMTRCAVLYQGRVQLFGDGGWGKIYITTFVGSYLKHLHYQHQWQCVAYSNTMKWALRDTDRGRHWLMAPAVAIYLCQSSNSPGSGVEEWMNVEVYQSMV